MRTSGEREQERDAPTRLIKLSRFTHELASELAAQAYEWSRQEGVAYYPSSLQMCLVPERVDGGT